MSSVMALHLLLRNGKNFQNIKLIPTSIYRVLSSSKRLNSDDSAKSSDLSSSTILIQDGLTVQELPVIVRKLKNVMFPFNSTIQCTSGSSTRLTEAESDIHQMIFKEFIRCSSLDDVYALLSRCSTITPNIALGALERIYNIQDQNSHKADIGFTSPNPDLLDKLNNIIIGTDDIYALMRALGVVLSKSDVYIDKFCDEILKRVADNKLSVFQVCDVIVFFSTNKNFGKLSENVEKLWTGIIGREKEIDEKTIIKCFSILNHLKTSQRIVLGVLERRMFTLWWQIKANSVIEILNSLLKNSIYNNRVFPILGRWMNTNIHLLSEENLFEIIAKLNLLKYNDLQIEKAIERYVKVKGLNIKLDTLVVAIMNHCSLFKIRNPHILSGCAEYFIVNGRSLSSVYIKPILYPFGYLYFQPSNGSKFWETVEDVLEKKFLTMSVDDILDIMLSCIYLEKYPLNFVTKIFNPHFLERINSSENAKVLRSKLKLLDTAMTLECKAYKGPLLPKDHHPKPFMSDGRVKRLVNHIRESFETIAGGVNCFSTFVILPYIYTTNLYVVDVMIHPEGLRNSILNLNLMKDRDINVALLINIPEHFCSKGATLLGPQMMRNKHLRILGLKVVNLNYDTLSHLRMHRKELNTYIINNLKAAQPAS